MVAVKSTMQVLGSSATAFSLPDVCQADELVSLSDFNSQPILLMFICNHCPFVIHLAGKMSEVANYYQARGFGVVAISSNDVNNYPQDGPDQMRLFADNHEFEFSYLYDETQAVAKAYGAACTPDFFVYDSQHKLVYRGQMDDSRPSNNHEVNASDLRLALEAVLTGGEVDADQKPSIGCNIKWKPGNEPHYF